MEIPLCIVLHHGGKWQQSPTFKYVGGNVKLINDIPTNFDANYLKTVIASLGYNNVIKLHYCDPLKSLHNGVRFLSYDDTTFTMFMSLLHEYRMIDVFTEHDDGCDGVVDVVPNIAGNMIIEDTAVFFNDANFVNEDIDYDELGSDNEDAEVREAREKIQEEKKLETDYVNEVECLHRLAERKGKRVDNDGSDYEDDSSDFDSPPNSDDEDDCGYLLPKLQNKRKPQMSAKGGKQLLGRTDQQCPFFLGQEFEDAVEGKVQGAKLSILHLDFC
ncbi:Translation initiation factor IF-2 [Bienertia sinuspersici]